MIYINVKSANCTLDGLDVTTVIIDISNDNMANSMLAIPIIFQVVIVVFPMANTRISVGNTVTKI